MTIVIPWINNTVQVLAHTIWAEDRGGGYEGMNAVANAICNRAAHPGWWGTDIRTVCLHKWQFSCWNPYTVGSPQDANFKAFMAVTEADHEYMAALAISQLAVMKTLPDITNGADSYYAVSIDEPAWAAKAHFTKQIQGQKYYITR